MLLFEFFLFCIIVDGNVFLKKLMNDVKRVKGKLKIIIKIKILIINDIFLLYFFSKYVNY